MIRMRTRDCREWRKRCVRQRVAADDHGGTARPGRPTIRSGRLTLKALRNRFAIGSPIANSDGTPGFSMSLNGALAVDRPPPDRSIS